MANKDEYFENDEPISSEEMALNIKSITQRFLDSYTIKDSSQTDEEWLLQRFKEELPEKTEEEISTMSKEIISQVSVFDDNLADLNEYREAGGTNEEWVGNKLEEAAVGVSVTEFGEYLEEIDKVLAQNNQLLKDTVTKLDGTISQNNNLDGFIAEQLHVNSFNANAALENQTYRAKVLAPEAGQSYGKNSMDIVIRDGNNTIHQYQSKYGKDATSTVNYNKKGNYNNQRRLVPEGQGDAVKRKFPNKSVSEHIGGTGRVSTKSEALSKEKVKKIQNRIQEKGSRAIPKQKWSSFSNRQLAINIGKQAALAGMGAAAIGVGFHIIAKILEGEEIKGSEVVKTAIVTGADAGVKAATAGALKVGVAKGLVPILAKGTPIGVITNIACVAIENIKILFKLAKGVITPMQALDLMARTTVSTITGMVAAGKGMFIGAALGLAFGPVGVIIGGIIGGTVGYLAGSTVGDLIYSGVKTVVSIAKEVVSSIWDGIESMVEGIGNALNSFGDWLFS